ncbi:hypothetical protein A374_02394 [Fictibacillus macauensis ZFHKF-1]|uniref:Uncharacterized protein n=1 Tax=Fictibacillus macauensis ZFHKF-1 TaxID=1196324 RepID=I8J5J3_9BACL|nr:YrvL family regulatory protein [Fictibacillus macauensis]EIT87066.1 hypothetical protein A374_02394 [Fictibacillus macauensis ZFHKF-1]
MKKGIEITIVVTLIGLLLAIFSFAEFIFLNLFGLQYESVGALLLFLFVGFLIDVPLSLLIASIPRVLKAFGMLKSSNRSVAFILHLGSAWILIGLLDLMMDGVSISVGGAFLVALVGAMIDWLFNGKDDQKFTYQTYEEIKKQRELKKSGEDH